MVKPQVNSEGQKELDKADEHFEALKERMGSYNPMDHRKPVEEVDPITKLSNREMQKMDAPYIKPVRSVNRPHSSSSNPNAPKTYWNEQYKKIHDWDWEYVKCKVENREIINEDIEVWTAKYGCDPAHLWRVPVNKPIYIPRLLASQLASCKYNKIVMQEEKIRNSDGLGTYTGTLEVEQTINRISCTSVASSF